MPRPLPSDAPALPALAWSAFRAGRLRSISWRPSGRSFSFAAAVCTFATPAIAAAFARRWALRLGVAVVVRGCSATVPVRAPLGCLPWSWAARSAPGVRGLARRLGALAGSHASP